MYLVGERTVGLVPDSSRPALTTLSPFMLHYSSEARGYALMMAFAVASTLALLIAVEGGRARWWVAYAAASCAAVYSHYTCVFLLAAQVAWVLWAHPEARRPALLANLAAAVAFLPWLGGLRGDLGSTTTAILSALQPFTLGYVRTSFAHWVLAYPYAAAGEGVGDLPGTPALVALGLALALGSPASRARVRARPAAARGGLVLVGCSRRRRPSARRSRAPSARTSWARATWPPRGRHSASASPPSSSRRAHGCASSPRCSRSPPSPPAR